MFLAKLGLKPVILNSVVVSQPGSWMIGITMEANSSDAHTNFEQGVGVSIKLA
jgi:hypothetical protein